MTKLVGRYEVASGQKLNMDKTSIYIYIFFSCNTLEDVKQEILLMSLPAQLIYDTYLGLPALVR